MACSSSHVAGIMMLGRHGKAYTLALVNTFVSGQHHPAVQLHMPIAQDIKPISSRALVSNMRAIRISIVPKRGVVSARVGRSKHTSVVKRRTGQQYRCSCLPSNLGGTCLSRFAWFAA
ncbi:uncharacterized protein K460DRAFT_173685 [Cucurbitaria berberidis CBS 394.84]|uniref:Uncharacterized protein n=1 Tax=Cucurbitaria berberidis CBS 394.84 TaxID=1168544 RepID=A0A9P4GAD0_9PLEO|nr:uncharacterized protein K460DRAFT_173685 [Cucurbitaria berberidis CBS 394.84]KAF1841797.1 hypothetical protein K460DRAFT_173685 [Cucurbitaria berberidis CBS 394.84]